MTDGKITKTEWILLALTSVFVCGLLILSFLDREQVGRMGISTEIDVPQEEILPDLSPLDLNTATEEELTQLPGIGEELARRIVVYREENGPFTTVDDLMNVSGIGEGKFEALSDRITVDGEEQNEDLGS